MKTEHQAFTRINQIFVLIILITQGSFWINMIVNKREVYK